MDYAIVNDVMTDHQLDAYLKKMAYGGEIAPTLSALKALQFAHLSHIPYENLDSVQGKMVSLNHQMLFDKIIMKRRGGYCFELNGLYAWLLAKFGFAVKNHAGRYIFPNEEFQMRRHRVMTVTIDGKRYLTDVGVNSECFRTPLLLEAGLVQDDGVSEYRLEQDPFWGWLVWQKLRGHDWQRLYGFTEEMQLDMDYVMPAVFCDIHPLSPMNKYEKVSIFTPTSNIRIWAGEYQVFENGEKKARAIEEPERTQCLRDRFGIVLSD